MKKEMAYTELAKAKIQEKRNIVISCCEKNNEVQGFTIGQQLEVLEGKRTTNVFMKGAFHIEDVNGLYNLRDALNVAIGEIENHKDTNEWDDE